MSSYLKQIINGFGHAARGLMYVLTMERNARIHLLSAMAVLLLGWFLEVSPAEQAAIFFAIVIVFLAEIVNTAFEKTLDLVDASHNEKVRVIKDMAAGAVLVASIAALVIGIAIFWPYLLEVAWRNR